MLLKKVQISIKIKNNSGQVLEYNIQPRNKILGVLLVPKMVKREDMIEINQEDLKDIINEIKNKKQRKVYTYLYFLL